MQTPANAVLLLGALAACTRVPSSARDRTEVMPTMMPQLAAESALAATIDSATADVRLLKVSDYGNLTKDQCA